MKRTEARRLISIPIVALALAAGCDEEKQTKPSAGCDEALGRAKQMLAVPDFDAAKDWTTRAKTLCGTDGQKPVADLEAEIASASDKVKKRDAAALAVVPAIVKAVGDYRALPKREACKGDSEDVAPKETRDGVDLAPSGICKSSSDAGGLTVQLWTKKGDATAFSAFTTANKRGLGCDLFGASEVKKARGTGETKRLWCKLKSGPLAELELLLVPSGEGERTDVYIFSPPWVATDEDLTALIKGLDSP